MLFSNKIIEIFFPQYVDKLDHFFVCLFVNSRKKAPNFGQRIERERERERIEKNSPNQNFLLLKNQYWKNKLYCTYTNK